MDRTIIYPITPQQDGLLGGAVSRRRMGYSAAESCFYQNGCPKCILVNGVPLLYEASAGGRPTQLQVRINEQKCSEKIPPVYAPLSIVYEDEDLIVVNKPAGMPIHPSLNHYNRFSCQCAGHGIIRSRASLLSFGAATGWTGTLPPLTVVAKHLVSGSILSAMTKKKEVRREYLAIVRGKDQPGIRHDLRPSRPKRGLDH